MRLQGIFYARFYLKPLPTNQKVAGSNPAGATIVYAALDTFRELLFFIKSIFDIHFDTYIILCCL